MRFLNDLWPSTQEAVERNPELLARIAALAETVSRLSRASRAAAAGVEGPVAFFCAEFGVHASLPLYSGGLGVLAGDILKEASDQALPMIGVGLFYRLGYFRQRIDINGRQQEYWVAGDPEEPADGAGQRRGGAPLLLSVEIAGQEIAFQVWRVDVGRVPLLLLDTELPENDPVQRWTSARLYESQPGASPRPVRPARDRRRARPARARDRAGRRPPERRAPGARAARARSPSRRGGASFERGARRGSQPRRLHDPHAGPGRNETYAADEFLHAFADLPRRLAIGEEAFLDLCRIAPGDQAERPGMTTLAIRVSARRNGVSRLHGEVARTLWRPLFEHDAARSRSATSPTARTCRPSSPGRCAGS